MTLLAPVGAVSLDERPELPRVVRDAQVTKLMHDDVVQHLGGASTSRQLKESVPRGEHEPQRALSSEAIRRYFDANAPGLFQCQG